MDGRMSLRAAGVFRVKMTLRAAVAMGAIAVVFLPCAVRGGDEGLAVGALPVVAGKVAVSPVETLEGSRETLALGPTVGEKGAVVEEKGESLPVVHHAVSEKKEVEKKEVVEKKESVEKKDVEAAPGKVRETLSELERSPIGGKRPAVTAAEKSDKVEKAEAAAPVKSIVSPGVANAAQVAAALTVVIGLILIGKALARKYLPQAKVSNGKGAIEVLARHSLCKNQSLVLVRIGSQIVALNQGKEMSQSVLVISDPTEVAKVMGQVEGQNPNSIQAGFSKLLANARMDLEDPANDPDRADESGYERESFELRSMEPENLDSQLDEMAAAKRQLMELRQQVRSVRDSLPRA